MLNKLLENKAPGIHKKLNRFLGLSTSIRVQMAIVISVFSLLVVLALIALIFTITHKQLKNQKISFIAEEIHGYGRVIGRQVEEFNYVAVEDLVKMVVDTSPNIGAIRIENEYQQFIAQHPSGKDLCNGNPIKEHDLYSISAPKKLIGVITVCWIIPEKLLETRALYQQVVFFGLAFMFLLSFLIYHYLAFSIATPLSQLEKKLIDIKPGESFKRSRLLPKEVQTLQDRYLAMVNKVHKQIEFLKSQANTDSLTQLNNRNSIEIIIKDNIRQAQQVNSTFAVLFLDLDHFKKINDVYGHDMGDQVLSEFAKVLHSSGSNKTLLGRFGGDEFIMVIPDLGIVESVVQTIYQKLEQPYNYGELRIFMSTSIGVATYPSAGKTTKMLLKNADLALYQSKRAGRNQASYYHPHMSQDSNLWVSTIDSIRSALKEKRYTCYIQPVYNRNNQLEWGELLFRLINENGEVIDPKHFLPVAEENGLMRQIAEYTCQFTLKLLHNNPYKNNVSINFSRSQLLIPNLDEIISPLLPWKDKVIIEVTEDSFLGETKTLNIIKKLRDLGFIIALDDFGSGYSSLSILLDLPIDIVKLDKEFQTNIQQHKAARSMLRSIIQMLNTLGKKVVAEGIENPTQNNFARTTGCHYLQGYYLGKPIPVTQYFKNPAIAIHPSPPTPQIAVALAPATTMSSAIPTEEAT